MPNALARLSVSRKLMLIFFVLLFMMSASLGWLAIIQSTQAVHEQVEQGLTSIATNAAEVVHSRIQTHLASVSELARHPTLLTPSAEAMQYLDSAAQRLGYLGMGWVNLEGIAHYPQGNTADLANRDYIQRALAGQSNLSNVIISRVINKPVIMLAAPIYDQHAQIQGVLIARLDATFLSDLTQDLGFGQQGYAFIINHEGVIVADRDRQQVLEQTRVTDHPYPPSALAFQQLLTQREGVIELPFETHTYLAGVVTIPGTNWLLGITAQSQEIFQRLHQLQLFLFIVSFLAWMLGLILAWWFSQAWVVRPLRHIQQVVQQIQASGNLNLRTRIQGQDELASTAEALNNMVARFQDIVAEQLDSTSQLFAASEHLDKTSQGLLKASAQQEEQTILVVTALQQMSQAIHEVTQHTLTASTKAETAAQEAQQGEQQMHTSQHIVTQLDIQIQQAAHCVAQLNNKTDEVDQVLAMISGIADQTNLLALNAAIEAARAGTHGRGFAVVADEVRTLANHSQHAAASIQSKMEAFRHEAQQALQSMQACTDFAQQNSHGAQKIGNLLNQSCGHTGEILALNQQIAAATEEQSLVIDQLNASLQQLTQGIHQVTKKAKETAGASFTLKDLAEKLKQGGSQFQL